MPFEGFLDRRHEDVTAILHCHPAAGGNADNILGKALDEFEHRLPLERDAPFEREHLLLALAIGNDDALAVHVLEAGGNERHRVPH